MTDLSSFYSLGEGGEEENVRIYSTVIYAQNIQKTERMVAGFTIMRNCVCPVHKSTVLHTNTAGLQVCRCTGYYQVHRTRDAELE